MADQDAGACPRKEAEQMLAAARDRGDRSQVASILADLGVMSSMEGDAAGAAGRLNEALVIIRQLGDQGRECDLLGNLGLAALNLRDGDQALRLFEEELALARTLGDRFAEKIALEHLGVIYSKMQNPGRALELFEQGLAVCRVLADREQEATLLWCAAIQLAVLGRRDEAITRGEAAVSVLRESRKPEANVYEDHLRRYRLGESSFVLQGDTMPGSGSFTVSNVASGQATPTAKQVTGPNLLAMAFSAAKSLTKFVRSGLKTAPAEIRESRLQTCSACTHFTGLRCRVCGCFASVKSRMAHESCPIGKWPAQ